MAIIYTYPKKNNPTSTDLVLISDSSDGNKTKNATISSLQSSLAGVSSVNTLTGAVLLNTASSNLVRTTTAGTNTISYDLASSPTIAGTLTAAGLKPTGGSNATTITHFETGTWTPNLQYLSLGAYADITTVSGITHTTQSGFYTRINNMVTLNMKLIVSNSSGSVLDCNGFNVTGLPFTPNTTYPGGGSLAIFTYSNAAGSSNMIPFIAAGGINLQYLSVRNPDPTYFGGTDTFANTSAANKTLPLATPTSTGQGSQTYLNTNTANSKSRLATGTTQWWGTFNYYII